MVVSAAPHLLAHVPGHGGANDAVGLWGRSGHRNWCWTRWSVCGAPDAIVLAAPSLLVQGPEPLALATVRLRGRRDVCRRCGWNDDWRCGGRGGGHRIQPM